MRPTRARVLMDTASLWADRSTCDRAHVGCVIELDGRILVQGYNGAPAGMDHCNHKCITPGACQFDINGHIDDCPANKPCGIAVHAEANAIAYAARHGIALQYASLWTTMAPCYACSQIIINAGISELTYEAEYRDMSGVDLLSRAGLTIIRMTG